MPVRPTFPRWELEGASFARALRFFAVDYPWVLRLRWNPRAAPPDSWASGDRAPVVLLPGVYESWQFLAPVGERLHRDGHPVVALPELGRNRLPIPATAALAWRAIRDRDLRDVVLVAHSKGGLIGKHLLAIDDDEERIDRLVAIATPFRGSSMASWMPGRALRAFRTGDALIRSLADERAVDARITSVFPIFDPHIPEGSRLAGARNVPLRMAGHFAPILDPQALEVVAREVAREG